MKLIVHDFAGHPFEADLSRWLARLGHTVFHVFCRGVTTGKGDLARRGDDPPGLSFIDVWPEGFERYSPLSRLRHEREYGARVAALVAREKPDVVISANAPLLAQRLIWRGARSVGARRVYWLQDFLGRGTRCVLANRSRLLGATAGRFFEELETRLLEESDRIIVISDDFLVQLTERGVTTAAKVIENWAPLDEVELRPCDNPWARAEGLVGRPVALYAGTLGLKHDPEHLVSAATQLTNDSVLVVVTEGQGRQYLERRKAELGLDRLILRDFVGWGELPDVLATATVCLVLLESDAGVFSVPSKVLTYLAAGRAVVAAIPSTNLAARTIERAGAGLVVEPGNHLDFGRAVASMLDDPVRARQYGASARAYAERAFDSRAIAAAVLDFIA